jgi:hypothetical protein
MGGKGSGRQPKLDIAELRASSGHKTKAELAGDTIQVLRASAPHAAKYLRDVILKRVKQPSWPRIDVCKFVIEHEIGKPRQKTELTGAGGTPLTWQAIIVLAEQADQDNETPIFPPQIAEKTAENEISDDENKALVPADFSPQPPMSPEKDNPSEP